MGYLRVSADVPVMWQERIGVPMDIQVGDIVKLKKQHPCGSHDWEVLRIGADFRLKCAGCGHQIMIARRIVEKNVREIRKREEQPQKQRGNGIL